MTNKDDSPRSGPPQARRSTVGERVWQTRPSVAFGVYKPRRPQASPLFRLVQDHLHRLRTVYDDRFARIRCSPDAA